MTRKIQLIMPLLLLSAATMTAHAAETGHCDSQARELTLAAWKDILPDMTADQRRDLQLLAAEVCARHAAHPPTTAGNTEEKPDEAEDDDDWFTEHVLEGEPADKPGNRRLERRSRY